MSLRDTEERICSSCKPRMGAATRGLKEVGEKGRTSKNISSSPDPVLRGPCSKKHSLKFSAFLKQLPAPPYEHQQNNTQTTFLGIRPEILGYVSLRSPPAVQQRIKKSNPFSARLFVFPRTSSKWMENKSRDFLPSLSDPTISSKSLHCDLH